MPLHDWADKGGWESVHQYWITGLGRWLKPRLPEGYRAILASLPSLTIDTSVGRPDVSVREWAGAPAGAEAAVTAVGPFAPDEESVAVFTVDPQLAVHVEHRGRLVAAIELVSPRNKDRLLARDYYLSRSLGYLTREVNLLLVDLLPRPAGFSFVDALAAELALKRQACPPPFTASYRVGEPVTSNGRLVATWQRRVAVGTPLPTMPLPLSTEIMVPVDLELTYREAAADAYLE